MFLAVRPAGGALDFEDKDITLVAQHCTALTYLNLE